MPTVQPLYVLPRQVASAAENMALDWLMLDNFPHPASVRMRFYGWSHPAWSFGYSQKWAEAHHAVGSGELVRRPTGGGLVDHRNDWTYALVFPAAHPLAQDRACVSYQRLHETIAAALNENGVACHLQTIRCSSPGHNFSVCFEKPEPKDVVRTDNGRKIAGAAQKRTRAGLLLQGSLDCLACPEVQNWEQFGASMIRNVGKMLELSPLQLTLNPPFYTDVPGQSGGVAETFTRFASREWNQKR